MSLDRLVLLTAAPMEMWFLKITVKRLPAVEYRDNNKYDIKANVESQHLLI